jgi:hypothetical protein
VGLDLLRAAIADWPIGFADRPQHLGTNVSFIIGHKGTERIPLLIATIASVAAQENAAIECVVVEQSQESVLDGLLPSWVRHVRTPPPAPDMPYSRSWAFNVGARAAAGDWLVLHDNDVVVPRRYAVELLRLGAAGYEAARLQRFVFYLGREATEAVLTSRPFPTSHPPQQTVQNCEGHTVAVKRETYWRVGGHDEAFLGWGGEDNEFLDRLRACRLHDYAYLPFVHLYHEPQAGKGSKHANTAYFDGRMRLPPSTRVAELLARPFGSPSGPVVEG